MKTSSRRRWQTLTNFQLGAFIRQLHRKGLQTLLTGGGGGSNPSILMAYV